MEIKERFEKELKHIIKIDVKCKNCGVTTKILIPKNLQKETDMIELCCGNCGYLNKYKYINRVDKK